MMIVRIVMKKNKMDKDVFLVNKAFDNQQKYLDKWVDNERYYNAEYEPSKLKSLKKSKRSRIFIPVTRNIVNIVKSIFSMSFFSQGCPIELIAVDDKGGEFQRKITKIIHYYYKKQKPNNELTKAFLSSLIYSMGIVFISWDSKKDKVVTYQVPITDIAFDCDARNIDDVEYVAYRFKESQNQIVKKIKTGVYDKNAKELIFKDDENITQRFEIKELYIRDGNKWIYKTFCKDILLRKTTVKKIPFKWGIALERLASVDDAKREDENLVYGVSLVELIKELNDEINQKRNQKNDIQEEHINPSIIISDKTQINPADMKKGAGQRIRAKGSLDGLMFVPAPNDYSLNNDLPLLDKDLNEASAVNSIQQGQTGASDRRSGTALAVVNANSTTRITNMVNLMKDTLFEHWAKEYVELVLKNADSKVIEQLTGDKYFLGAKGNRKKIDYEININFGMTVDKDKKINDLMNVLLPISQNQNINPKISERILKQILTMNFGEAPFLKEVFVDGESEPLDENEQKAMKELGIS